VKKHGVKLLVIDDDKFIRASLARALRSCGAELIFADCGEAGLDILRNEHVGVIICDQRMPGMGGSETLTRSREISPDAIRITLTGQTDLTSALRAVNDGKVSSFLLKPWDDEHLRKVVTDSIAQYEQRLEAERMNEITRTKCDDLKLWTNELETIVAERTDALREAYDETLSALVMALDAREHATAGHSRRVAVLCNYLAITVGVDHEDLEDIYRGALLHDIGKVGIPDAILLKTGALDKQERAMIETHVTIGEGIVSRSEERRVGEECRSRWSPYH